jgi:hypothetical protein
MTYGQLAVMLNRYARWALAQGALLNTNLRGAGLAHSIEAARPKLASVDATLADVWMSAMPAAGGPCRGWVHGTSRHDLEALEPVIEQLSGA